MLSLKLQFLFALFSLFVLNLAGSAIPSPAPAPGINLTPDTDPVTTTYADGRLNPFWPCGITEQEVSDCPYRCYKPTGDLSSPYPTCYSASEAKTAISQNNICVQCFLPNFADDRPGKCQPLNNYLASNLPPPPCGSNAYPLPDCTYTCQNETYPAGTPGFCSFANTTVGGDVCTACTPTCSSPRIVFDPPNMPLNFSISNGNCSVQNGPQEAVACPWRCSSAAGYAQVSSWCSMKNETDSGAPIYGYTTCTSCK